MARQATAPASGRRSSAGGGAAREGDAPGVAIERDPQRVRLAADEVVVGRREGQVLLSLLARDLDPTFQHAPQREGKHLTSQAIENQFRLVEIAKVRIPEPEAFSMAMQIVEATIAAGNIRTAGFRKAVLEMLDQHDARAAAGTDDAD